MADGDGKIVAAAYGNPPAWCEGIEGAEAWGLLQALTLSIPSQSKYWVDCLPLYTQVQKGKVAAENPKNVLARVHGMIFAALDYQPGTMVGWMPAHLTANELGWAYRSDGELVDEIDLKGNDVADRLAKLGVESHRVPQGEVDQWDAQYEMIADRAV